MRILSEMGVLGLAPEKYLEITALGKSKSDPFNDYWLFYAHSLIQSSVAQSSAVAPTV